MREPFWVSQRSGRKPEKGVSAQAKFILDFVIGEIFSESYEGDVLGIVVSFAGRKRE